jgi:hypothetical protein
MDSLGWNRDHPPGPVLILAQLSLRIICCALMSGLEFTFNLKLVLLVLSDLKKSEGSSSQRSESDIYNQQIVMRERRRLIGVLVGVTILDLCAVLLISLPSDHIYIRFGSLIYSIHITLSLLLLEMLFHSMTRIRYALS